MNLPDTLSLTAVVAMTPSRVIGYNGGMPWHLPGDLQTFKRITMGHPVLMGSKTFRSIGRPLPGRQNIVLSRDSSFAPEGVEVIRSLDALGQMAFTDPELMVIGGAAIYEQLLAFLARIWVSRIHREYEGDTWFPAFEHLFPAPVIVERKEGFDLLLYERN